MWLSALVIKSDCLSYHCFSMMLNQSGTSQVEFMVFVISRSTSRHIHCLVSSLYLVSCSPLTHCTTAEVSEHFWPRVILEERREMVREQSLRCFGVAEDITT